MQNPSEFRARALGLLLCSDVTEWMRKGVLLQQGAVPTVPPETRAFEAPHEKCQDTQRMSLNHRDLKFAR